jgi:hypothetical protein
MKTRFVLEDVNPYRSGISHQLRDSLIRRLARVRRYEQSAGREQSTHAIVMSLQDDWLGLFSHEYLLGSVPMVSNVAPLN